MSWYWVNFQCHPVQLKNDFIGPAEEIQEEKRDIHFKCEKNRAR